MAGPFSDWEKRRTKERRNWSLGEVFTQQEFVSPRGGFAADGLNPND